MATLKYRPDVDGLRAIAVLPVVFFHVDLIPFMEGGYVGVDVFFVISGFLITAILHREMGEKRFSIVRFYERRVRRLWPALVVVVAFSVAFAYWLLLPSLLKDFGQSLVAVTVFGSNILFFLEAGYFDGPAELKPLLHTWSLAVEEQFYLFFPPMLWAIHRWALRWLKPIIVVSLLLSLGACVLIVGSHQSAAFYLLPFRAWEMLLGSILSVGLLPAFRSRGLASASGLVGLGMILVSVATFTKETVFPGWSALLPCVGTLMVIHAGLTPATWGAKLLGLAPLVFIGKISYSLYLWHWPFIVFGRLLTPEGELDAMSGSLVVVASIAVAAVSWRWVEAPFRSKDGFSRKQMFIGAAVVSALWMGAGVALHVTGGAAGRLSDEEMRLAVAAEDFFPEAERCGEWAGPDGVAEGFCLIGDPEVEAPSYFLWGDSHAGILVHGADAAATEAGRAGLYSNRAGCPPLRGVQKDESVADTAEDEACTETNARVLRVIEEVDAIETVILIGRWAYYSEGRGVGTNEGDTVALWPIDGERGARPQREVFEEALEGTVEHLLGLGKRVYVLRPIPEIPEYDATALANAMIRDAESGREIALQRAQVPRAEVDARQASFDRAAAALEGREGLGFLDPRGFFCDAETCWAIRDGQPLYYDNNHVTTSTSRELAPVFEPAFE
ncbi:MAG TPA: acyltransferase family protein [Polyangiaceae bacterium LLY-WYZ-15_(1-7)]|nr:acyltransferase [Myxococcales bacterium]MAT27477.1 acyltransferase [Sandaracinus sp.]HJK93500.1 acyltransferase family protein [Polyangiaceae bacterium LLY-WYZ-15_(1-7)]HJL02318.1 acyltransferase family protein [Polyangiaceae bacterium LLY-WYZ-15_(1-7)]HJL12478.1 acyltransferase family protein [Polyangiaceae bacterium LLY-WYZ-15_(1-7)]